MTYVRRFTPATIGHLEEYERIAFETGLRGDLLRRAWDAKMEGREAVSNKRVDPPPKPKPTVIDPDVKERIRKLRAKARDRAVTPEEAKAFADKANELVNKYVR